MDINLRGTWHPWMQNAKSCCGDMFSHLVAWELSHHLSPPRPNTVPKYHEWDEEWHLQCWLRLAIRADWKLCTHCFIPEVSETGADMVLCFRFLAKLTLVIPGWYSRFCWATFAQHQDCLCFSLCPNPGDRFGGAGRGHSQADRPNLSKDQRGISYYITLYSTIKGKKRDLREF